MKGFIIGVVITLAVIFGGFYLTVSQGWFPVGADNPPGALERKYANMAMDAYVEKHMPQGNNPVQANSSNLMEGAILYEKHCALCHGGGKDRTSPLAHKFSPPVPQILQRIPHDPDAHLFWMVKHGARMTGMPSWEGVMSDDEIWKTVSFIKHSNNLPPDVQQMWEQASQQHATTNEVTPTPKAQQQNAKPQQRKK
ncbi:MAG: c-type cytochrome [Terriglobia bacterium]|nr:c-type cytochrome [Terriglobia bacterium]